MTKLETGAEIPTMTEEKKAKIYEGYHGKVLRYLRGKIGDSDLAEDLASEVFLKVYRNIDRFDTAKASVSTWIYTITQNTLTDYYRTRRVHNDIPETLAEESTVVDEVCNDEMLETLAKAMKSLDERERRIVILRFYSGKTLKEISETLGISYAYVKILQNKALAELKKFF